MAIDITNENKFNILRDKLNKMIKDTDGKVTEEIVEVSQALDELIMDEMKRNKYDGSKK